EALLAASDDPDEDARRMIADVLGTIKAEAAIPRLQELMQDVPLVGRTAVRGLENIGTPEALAALRAGIAVADNEVRARAAISLLRFGDDTVREVIALALAAAQLGDQRSVVSICQWLGNAVERRRIPGPGPDGRAHTSDPDAWITWLCQTP
ncbi:MAG: HEAT repeat domain-containing protein, partial [Armatimonadota bacterium]